MKAWDKAMRRRAKIVSKVGIAKEIERLLKKKKAIPRTYSVVIPEGGYDYEEDEDGNTWMSGDFEVFSTPNDIHSYGKFRALVEGAFPFDWELVVHYKGKEYQESE